MSVADQDLLAGRAASLARPASLREPTLQEFLRACPGDDPEALAQMIDADGRARLLRGERLSLDDYLAARPELRNIPVALDAAIDMALRSLSGAARPSPRAVEQLAAQRPDLAREIRDAALLASALWSTDQAPAQRSRYSAGLPCDFGEPLPNGQTPYRLVRLLGSGATGEVFLAEDTQLSEPGAPAYVAIKTLPAPAREAWDRRRLVEEAAKARRVDHPNVVRALHCGVTPHGEDFVAFEFVDGLDLFAWAAQHGLPRPPRQAAEWIRDVARAVHAAHSVGLAHCDLKPANILVTPNQTLKVTDFGIAVRWQEQAASRGTAHAPGGTLAFMAPEQFRREDGAAAPPADIFALGGALFWLLTGRLPNGVTPEEIAFTHDEKVGRCAGPSVRALLPSIDRDLDAICARALAPRPADRHASAAELAEDLQSWLDRKPIRWRNPSIARTSALLVRRRPWTAALTGALVLGALASAITFWRLSVIAIQRRAEVNIARAAKDAAEGAKRAATKSVPLMMDSFSRYLKAGWGNQGLGLARAFQDALGSKGLDIPAAEVEFRAHRIDILRHLIDTSVDAEGRPAIASIAWLLDLAFLHATGGDGLEARRAVERIRAEFGPRISATDPVWAVLDTIEASGLVHELIARPKPDAQALTQAARLLEVRAEGFIGGRDWGPVRALAVSTLVEAYGPKGLNLPQHRLAAEKELELVLNKERVGAPRDEPPAPPKSPKTPAPAPPPS